MSKLQVHMQIFDPVIKSALSQKIHIFLWLYASAITAAEIITAYFNPVSGIVCHVILMLALLVHASLAYRQPVNVVYMALALAPMIRIMSLSMPLVDVPPMYWYLIISLPLFAAAVAVMRIAGFKPGEVGLVPGNLPFQMLVAFLGVPLGLLEYLILRPDPLVPALTFSYIWLPALILLVSTGVLEEFIFRGVMYRAAVDNLGRWYSIMYISFIFGVLHITHRSPLDLLFVLGVALLFSVAVSLFRSILGVSLAHGLTNIGLYLIWPHLLK
ncbi:MAG: putative metal-dependent membrane protease [Pelotomaculum thermopropionicum]|uniref:Putative metal-dependent membrane protease n=1 Tax=Pelotomaculum thermopropionicum TaxID=110500 RepID=A0A124FYZ8_9FIRM|nr:MAG: putative metal-dependent membrane protease [Pelotomaculum thermopropionicum]